MEYVEMAWGLMNTPMGFAISGFIILFVINKIFDKRPGWSKYEGFMISAIRQAEKWIPNDTDSNVLGKADKALEYFIKSYEKAKGKKPSKKVLADVQNGMSIVHHKIEGDLKKAA